MTARRPRVLCLALDAMDADLVRQWAEAGFLPTFRALFERSTFGRTRNPPGLFVGAVWPSFFTAVSPTRHGRYADEQLIQGTYSVRRFFSADLKRRPFWDALSEDGRRVAVVDVPKAPLTAGLNGVQVADWGTHDPEADDAFRTWPPSLAVQVAARYGTDPVGDCNHIGRTAAGIDTFRRSLETRIQRKTILCQELLEQEDWDLLLAVFAESHCAGHQLWALHDSSYPSHDAELAGAVGDPLRDVYVALDGAIGALLCSAGRDVTVLVFTSHGMGPHYEATFMLEEILERLDRQPGAARRRIWRWAGRYWHALWRRIKFGAHPRRPLVVGPRRCFAVPNNDVCGGIRVNLAGREPRGRVRPGPECDALFAELRRELLQLVNADTGAPVVRDVIRMADAYPGERVDEMPDFYVQWNREAPISRVSSPAIGTVRKRSSGVRSGDHRAEGFFWAMGSGIDAGRDIGPVSVMDFAPTLAALLGSSLGDVDGKLIPALLRPSCD